MAGGYGTILADCQKEGLPDVKYVSEFRNRADAELIRSRIHRIPDPGRRITIMEVCGSHTMAIHRFGIRRMLPSWVRLVSGPGCPVCVTGVGFIDQAVALARLPGVVVATFGDMVRVPGSRLSLAQARAAGGDVRVVPSPMDAVRLAGELPDSTVVFLGVGFETTSPTVAASVTQAAASGVKNFAVLAGHKLIPPAMRLLAEAPELAVDGFLCPAHVSAVIGTVPYRFLAEKHGKACVVAGFEPLDILRGVELILLQISRGAPSVENEYARVVKNEGNPHALRLLAEVFSPVDEEWRGFGVIPASGCALRPEWERFDVRKRLEFDPGPPVEPAGCRCGEILRGVQDPVACPLFGGRCTPDSPVGACMVSQEGTCAAWYRHGAKADFS